MDIFYPREEKKEEKNTGKVKNFIAMSVILAGLFIGSLFVDIAQLITGSGFSQGIIQKYDILSSGGKTWVAYKEPKVSVQVITDESCKKCDPQEALVWLRRVMPTIQAFSVESTSSEGLRLTEQMNIVSLPAFIFSRDVASTDFYSQASSLFIEGEAGYFFDMGKIGLPVGKYLDTPQITERDATSGPKDAKVTIVEFSDFQCAYCKEFQSDLNQVLKEYAGKVLFVYKHFPLPSHAQAENASLASLCANEQGNFSVYANYLFAKQDEWGKMKGTQKFKDYAWYLGLNGRRFSQCLDTKKYEDTLDADKSEAQKFSFVGVPSTFINDVFLSGAVTKEVLRQVIDEELAK